MDLSAPKLPPKPVREQAKVLYAYEAQNEDELTIREGDIINVLSKEIEDQGWFKGELNGKVGVFPDNFVELVRVPSAASATVTEPDSLPDKGLPPRPTGKPAAAAAAASTPPTTTTTTAGLSVGPLIKSLTGKSSDPAPVNGKEGSTKSSIFANLTKKSSSPAAAAAAASKVTPATGSAATAGRAFYKPDVVPLDVSQEAAGSVSVENGSSESQPASLTGIEVPAGSKLSHMTATRPKGPSNRRPPSYIAVTSSGGGSSTTGGGGRDSLTDAVTENGHTDTGPANGKQSGCSAGNNVTSPSSASVAKGKEEPPWILELRRTQEAKKQSQHGLPPLAERQSSVDSVTSSIAGTDSGPSSLVQTRSSALTKSQSIATAPSSGGSSHPNHRASGDFSNRIGQFNGSPAAAASGNNSTNSGVSGSNSNNNSITSAADSCTPNPVSILKPSKPMKPVTGSGTAAAAAVTGATVSSALGKKEVPTSPAAAAAVVSSSPVAASHVSSSSSSSSSSATATIASSSAAAAIATVSTKSAADKVASSAVIAPTAVASASGTTSSSSSASVNTSAGAASGGIGVSSLLSGGSLPATPGILPDPATPALIAELQREVQVLRNTTVPRTEYHDLAKQVQELRDLVEQQKQTQSRIVKELIDDLAEERKKLAMLTIDVDRLRKLSSATV